MKNTIEKYQNGNMVINPKLLPPVKKEKHWSEMVPESWNWLSPYKPEVNPTDWAINIIKGFEGFEDKKYLDGKGLSTIGYGTRDKKYLNKGEISEEEASLALRNYLEQNVIPVLSKKPYYENLKPNQKASLQSLIYNIGPTQFNNSKKLQQALLEGNWEEAAKQMDHGMTDTKNPGLKTRRIFEQNLFTSKQD